MENGEWLANKSSIFHPLIFTILLSISPLFALTINIKRGMESGSAYAILDLRNNISFRCSLYKTIENQPLEYRCTFPLIPKDLFSAIRSDFFNISYEVKESQFILKIKPTKKSKLFPLPPAIYEKSVIKANFPESSKHWILVGYEKVLPFLGKQKRFTEHLSFPLDWKVFAMPSVGAVDLNGDPVFIKNNRDVERFIAIKEAFSAGKYSKAYDLAKEAREIHPKSIFETDFLRYEIKSLAALDMKENAEKIIKLGKEFIKQFTSDEHLPEVLLILARVHSAIGFVSDASYFFDRLIHEHPGTKYANLGRIYLGDQLYMGGKIKEAMNLYLEALYDAKDIEVASLVAYKLAVRYLDRGKTDKGILYLKKIWDKNPEFLLKDVEDAHRIAQQIASRNRYQFAIDINKKLLKRLKKLNPIYEEALFEIAEWYDDIGKFREALQWYERYLKEFAYGRYSDQAKDKIDALFVAGSDVNATEALKKYNELIESYAGKSIAEKALVAKLKVLFKMNRLDEIVKLKPDIENIKDESLKQEAFNIFNKVVEIKFKEAVKANSCEDALYQIETYEFNPGSRYDEFLFSCFTEYVQYDKALAIAKKHLRDKDIDKRVLWLCRTVHILRQKENSIEAYKALQDLDALLSVDKNRVCQTHDWDKAWILYSMERYPEYFAWIKKLLKKYPSDIRLTEYLKKGIEAAQKSGDTVQQIWMLEKLIELQNRVKAHPYSPWAEFEAIRLYKILNKPKKALAVAESMSKISLEPKQKSRWLYQLGELYIQTGSKKSAKKAFEKCRKITADTPWKQLCEDALSLE